MDSHQNEATANRGVPIVHLQPQPVSSDIAERIPQVFPTAPDAVTRRLDQLRHEDSLLFSDRIIRCIVFCTWHYPAADIDHWIAKARLDYRDLIVAAEYDRADNHLRDFNRPFRDGDFATTNGNGQPDC